MQNKIYKRQITDKIIKYLPDDVIIVLHGARQVGKTHILFYLKDYLQEKKEIVNYIDLEDLRFVDILDKGVDSFLKYLEEKGYNLGQRIYVFLDEIQNLKNPTNFLKLMADHHKNIKLIVSGSSSFAIRSKFKDSLVGRTVDFEIFGLSFQEFLHFKKYSISTTDITSEIILKELKDLFRQFILFGSYPRIVLTDDIDKKEIFIQQIINTYLKKDVSDLAQIKVDKFNNLLRTLASQSSNLLNINELSNTCDLAVQTIEKYLFILEDTYIIKLLYPYAENIRSELFKTKKIFFYDPSLQQMLWLKNLNREIMGNVFETTIFSELIKKYGRENINYWRTRNKQEINFIIQDKDKVIPLEVKMRYRDKYMKSLLYFGNKYKLDNLYCITFKKDPDAKYKNITQLYPWETGKIK